ncbi:MAG: DUF1501 domain-containing protein [Planctomycetaceae bacterium]
MLTINGHVSRTCSGLSRRAMLQASGAGLLGLSLPRVLAAEQTAGGLPVRAKSVIFMMLFGGPSQFETFDMKPDGVPDVRGPFQPIDCRTPGLRICEHLPRLANVSDKFCVIRSMTHDFNDHSGAGHYIQTGHRWHIPVGAGFSATPFDWPSMGSVVEFIGSQAADTKPRDVPGYAVVPNRLGRLQAQGQYVRPGEYAGWLGQSYNPLTTQVDRRDEEDNPYWRNCSNTELQCRIQGLDPPTTLQLDRLNRRVSLLEQMDQQRRIVEESLANEMDLLRQRAMGLVSSSRTREALDLEREPAEVRDRYGRHLFGQASLMARRLVEAGTRFVTVHYDCCDGYSWDSHVHSDDVRQHLLPTFDDALAALLTDLDERGLLSETLVVAIGEMGHAKTDLTLGTWSLEHSVPGSHCWSRNSGRHNLGSV